MHRVDKTGAQGVQGDSVPCVDKGNAGCGSQRVDKGDGGSPYCQACVLLKEIKKNV